MNPETAEAFDWDDSDEAWLKPEGSPPSSSIEERLHDLQTTLDRNEQALKSLGELASDEPVGRPASADLERRQTEAAINALKAEQEADAVRLAELNQVARERQAAGQAGGPVETTLGSDDQYRNLSADIAFRAWAIPRAESSLEFVGRDDEALRAELENLQVLAEERAEAVKSLREGSIRRARAERETQQAILAQTPLRGELQRRAEERGWAAAQDDIVRRRAVAAATRERELRLREVQTAYIREPWQPAWTPQTKPWQLAKAEKELSGPPSPEEVAKKAAELAPELQAELRRSVGQKLIQTS